MSKGLLVGGALLLAFAPAVYSSPQDNGLVSWWPAEGNVNDAAGDDDGMLMNGATFAPGKVGQAFSFDGVDDGISILKSKGLNMRSSDFTIEAWVNVAETQTHQGAIFFNYAGVPYYALLVTADAKARVIFRPGVAIVGGAQDPAVWATGTTSLNDGKWHHLVGVRSSATALIYVDGVLEGSATNPAVLSVNGGSVDTSGCAYARIGAVHTSVGHCSSSAPNPRESYFFFEGLIDQVRIYNRALSECEIQGLAE